MDLTEQQLRLLNIIEDRFESPGDAGGKFLFSAAELSAELEIFYPGHEMKSHEIEAVLTYLNFETTYSGIKGKRWLIRKKQTV